MKKYALCNCLLYEPEGYDPPVVDVISYDIRCKIHGWRWNYKYPKEELDLYIAAGIDDFNQKWEEAKDRDIAQ